MTAVKRKSKKAIVREQNMRRIIAAAEQVFAENGYGGGTTKEIARRANLPKANVHYYFPTKEALYMRVLADILQEWIADAEIFDTSDDPEVVFRAYIRRKMEHSFTRPHASKVWAIEIISRGKVFDEQLKGSFLKWNRKKVTQIRAWIREGKLADIDPQHVMFCIWATTQHYADFEHQIRAVNAGRPLRRQQMEEAIESVTKLFLQGILPPKPVSEDLPGSA